MLPEAKGNSGYDYFLNTNAQIPLPGVWQREENERGKQRILQRQQGGYNCPCHQPLRQLQPVGIIRDQPSLIGLPFPSDVTFSFHVRIM